MISLDTKNIFTVGSQGLTKKQYDAQKKYLKTYLADIKLRAQGFYTIVDDMVTVRDIETFASSVKGVYSSIVVLGIGGSSLGTICLRDALTHLYGKKKAGTPTLYVLDNIDPILIQEVGDVIDVHSTLFIVISKSGTTPETMSQYYYFRKRIEKEGLDAQQHMVFVTDPERGVLRDIAREDGIRLFSVPPNVGGRFSVLTSVGLLPAALIGIDIRALLAGARDMRDIFLSSAPTKNLSFQLATVQYLLNTKRGKTMCVMMPYAQKLARFADWNRQLLAESIGKKKNRKGKVVHAGITPINALGATDQHSQSQLYNEGPHDKLFIFLTVDTLAKVVRIPNAESSHAGISYLRGTSFNELIAIEQQATAEAFTKNKRPNLTITIPQIDEEHLGQLFLLFEGATAFLGEMYGIDAYNQPGVELSKQITKEVLVSKT